MAVLACGSSPGKTRACWEAVHVTERVKVAGEVISGDEGAGVVLTPARGVPGQAVFGGLPCRLSLAENSPACVPRRPIGKL